MHEEIRDDSIYQGVSTFSEVLARAKSKDEEAHILQHQKELKERIQCYRALQIDVLEKVRKDREEKEDEATKNLSMATFPNGNKGKGLMEDLPEVPVREQVKALMLTSTQSKHKLEMMTSVLNTQAVTATVNIIDIPVIAAVSHPSVNEEIVEQKPQNIEGEGFFLHNSYYQFG